jgi:predicted house-cleaning noncanonical NTP pyrophosphatase (MazG superfamily)
MVLLGLARNIVTSSTSEYYSNLYFYIRSFVVFGLLRFANSRPLPDVVPDKEDYLNNVAYSLLISTIKDVNVTLVNPVPKDEEDSIVKQIGLSINRFVSRFFYDFLDTSVVLNNDTHAQQAFGNHISPFINGVCPQPSFDKSLLDYNYSILKGPFYGTLKKSCGAHFVIDSSFMQKYNFKDGLIPPVMKALFTVADGRLVLDNVFYDGKNHTKESPGFELGKKILNNYLLIDTIINKHLIVSHFKFAQSGAFAIRKYMSSSNRIKQFLYNFSFGVNAINHATDLLIGKGYGSVAKWMPFTEGSLIDYINDRIAEDHSSTCFPETECDLNESLIEKDCGKIYQVFKKYVKLVLQESSKEEYSECKHVVNYLRENVKEFQNRKTEEILASYMYVTSVVHEIKQDIYNLITQGYSCPVSINKDQSVSKYIYLSAMLPALSTTVPMRTLFVDLPESYSLDTKVNYYSMLNELKQLKLDVIKIRDVDSSVQV